MPYTKWLIASALVFFPALALTVQGAANVIFYLLFLLSLVGLVRFPVLPGESFLQAWKKYLPLNLAMSGLLVAILISQSSTGIFVGRSIDSPVRMALFPFIFWILQRLSIRHMKLLQWGLIAGAFFSAINMYVITRGGTNRETQTYFITLIAFAEMGLLLGVFSLMSIGWNRRSEKWLISLKILAGCAGLYCAYLSQTRGAWVAFPLFIAIAFFQLKNIRTAYRLAFAGLFFIFLAGIFFTTDIPQHRVNEAETEISQYVSKKNSDTSLGVRIQLWQGSWILFGEHPLLGVSRERFSLALQDLSKRRIISPFAASYPHSHNEVLYNMATLGVFGLLAILSLYFVPVVYFLREMRNADSMVRSTASMGLALCLGYFVFGLTDVMFMWGICNTFYVVNVAIFFAFIVKRKIELLTPPSYPE